MQNQSSDTVPLRCSFCNKAQAAVGKLISSPRDSPRVYICDECVAVCATIIDDERNGGTDLPVSKSTVERDDLLNDPLTSDLIAAVVEWVRLESLGQPAGEQVENVRKLVAQMIGRRGMRGGS